MRRTRRKARHRLVLRLLALPHKATPLRVAVLDAVRERLRRPDSRTSEPSSTRATYGRARSGHADSRLEFDE